MGRVAWLLVLSIAGCGAKTSLPDGRGDAPASGASSSCSPLAGIPSIGLPLLWYELDGDVKNTGSLGAPFDGVDQGATWVTGKLGQGAEVGSGYLELPGSKDLLFHAKALTIALWLKADLATEMGQPFINCIGDTGYGFMTFHGFAGEGAASLNTMAAFGPLADGISLDLGTDGWHHILYRYAPPPPGDIARLAIYVDGRPAASDIAAQEALFEQVARDIRIGLFEPYPTPFQPSHHVVDDVRVYGEVFSEEQQCEQIVGGSWCDGVCRRP